MIRLEAGEFPGQEGELEIGRENPFMRSNRSRIPESPRVRRLNDGEEKKSVYDFPTNPEGKFAQAMSNIACNPSHGAKGPVPYDFASYNSFSE